GLTKAGPGTLTLGSDNPYTGVTTINGGVLVLNTPNFNTYRGGDILINNGSTLRVTQTGGSVRYDFQGKTFAFDSAGGGTIDTGTGVNFVFATAYNVTNRIVTSGGARDSIIGNSGINMGDQPGDATVFDVARGADANSDLTVRVPMGNVGLGGVIKTGSGILELAGTNTYSGPTTVNNGTMVVSGLLPAGGRIMDNGMVVFNRSDTLKVTGAIAGTGALTQNGSGAIELANNPTYTGATTVSNGALRLAGGRVAATTLPVTSGLIARFDAAALTGLANGDTVSIWNDTSGSGNDASLAAGTPTYAAGALNGRAVVRFPGDGNSSFSFPEQSDIKTVFWVVNEANVSLHFLLGDNTAYNFHRGDGGLIWNSTYASSYIQNGTTRKNGAVVNGTTTALGTGWNMLDVVTSGGGVIADQITLDRNIANRSWSGDIAEIIIYNTALTAAQVQQVEDYLNYKWGVGVPANVNLSSSSGVSVAPNALFGGGGSAGNVTVAANGIIEGGYNSAGTLTLSNLTFNGAGTIKVSATAGTTPLVVNNTLALSTTPVSISLANAPTTGTYHLLQFGTLTGTGGFTIPPTRIYTLAINGNYLDLIVSGHLQQQRRPDG
ncbi:MAG: autotransporter-associated beta strand repeat-containing protein, partial [Verrucomicrobia bacterium]|nr:autotransporter-associated beta strand repeat-containing protein [Verrucomicrobiota bacterium]